MIKYYFKTEWSDMQALNVDWVFSQYFGSKMQAQPMAIRSFIDDAEKESWKKNQLEHYGEGNIEFIQLARGDAVPVQDLEAPKPVDTPSVNDTQVVEEIDTRVT